MKRRKFIKHLGHSLAIPGLLGSASFSLANTKAFKDILQHAITTGKKLVLIYLDGGNDGLNTVIPLSQLSTLNSIRPHVILPENKLLPISGTSLALHPALSGFKELYDENRLSIIQSVGYPNQNFSHFRSSDIWLSGSDANQLLTSGWAGRMLAEAHPGFPEEYPNETNPHPLAVEIGFGSSLLFQGPTASMSMVLNNANFFYELIDNVVQEAPDTNAGDKLKYIRLIAQQSQVYGKALKEAAEKVTSQEDYPAENDLAQQLKVIARLIKGGIETPLYLIRLGGFDTHDAQVEANDHTTGEHAELLKTLNDAVMAFMNDLESLGIGDDVVGMTFSEFGRRIVSNASLGTDHGSAAPMFVFGNKVRGGVIGDDPIISPDTTYDDNLDMQFDYRQVYASMMQQWLGKDVAATQEVLFNDFDTLAIIGDQVTGNKKQLSKIEFTAFPNPVQNTLNISLNHNGGPIQVDLFDLNGRKLAKIYRGILETGNQNIHWQANHLPQGTYKLVLQSKHGVSSTSLIKQ